MDRLISNYLPSKEYCEYDLTEGGCLRIYRNVTLEEYTKFRTALQEKSGIKLTASHDILPKRAASFQTQHFFIHIYHNGYDDTLRVITESRSEGIFSPVPGSPGSFRKVCPPELTVISLDYRNSNILDANGMSFVLTLEDGSFVIYDGGGVEDAEPLYRYLREKSPFEDHRIVISGWFLTHSHGDHYSAFKGFSRMYADKVTLKYIFLNAVPPKEEMINPERHDDFLNREMPELAKQQYGNVAIVRVHTGQVIRLPGMEVEVLQTYEDILPQVCDWLNEAALVTRVHVKGQTVLFAADAELKGDRALEQYGNTLKSDILQVTHHGWSGGSDKLIEMISPSYLLWTTNYECYTYRIMKSWHGGLNYRVLNYGSVKYSLVADGAYKIIRFPISAPQEIRFFRFPHQAF